MYDVLELMIAKENFVFRTVYAFILITYTKEILKVMQDT